MAKKTNSPNANIGNQSARPTVNAPKKQPQVQAIPGNAGFMSRYMDFFIAAGIAIFTYICYKTCIDNKLTNWDDLGYIINNALIKDPSPDAIKNIFNTRSQVMGNYHPITILPYYFEYAHSGLDPEIYHRDSVLMHVLMTITIYCFTKVLTRRTIAAAIVALLFGIHPMHVESVAWAAGRKDIIYGFFFILACITHIYYVRKRGATKWLLYIVGIILFALSLLSKAVAVTLPITLMLIDFIENRRSYPLMLGTASDGGNDNIADKVKLIASSAIEKIPHFVMAFAFGYLATSAQNEVGATTLDVKFNVLERFSLGCYALCTYLWKAVVPAGLSNFYPYPLKVADALPPVFYVYPLIVIALALVIWRFARNNKSVLFGVAFFLVNIVLLLQFKPVGGAIVSDRYGYIPYFGVFFLLGWYVSEYFDAGKKLQTGKALLVIVLAYSLVLGYMTNERCKDWYDSVSLWKDDIEKHPEAPVGYFYLGQEYFTRYETATNPAEKKALGDSSLANFNLSVARKPDYINPIICIAELQRNYGLIDDAKKTLYQALKISDKNESVFLDLGVIYSIKHQYDSAEYAFKKALALKTFLPEGYSNFANYLDIVGKTDSSLAMYAISISQNPDAYIPYLNRGRIFLRLQKYDEAIKDLNKAAAIKPEVGDIFYIRAKSYAMKGNKTQALADVEKAKSLGVQVDPAFMQQLK